jgi:hypothetical protein
MIIRLCRDNERDDILAIINAAAEAYRGVIPADRWHEPYMPASSEPDHPCNSSFFATLGLCTRHKKVPPLHPADMCQQDHPRPVRAHVS